MTTVTRRLAAAFTGVVLAVALTLTPTAPAYASAGKTCPAGVFVQAGFFFNPFWLEARRLVVSGTPSFTYRWFGTGIPFFYESGPITAGFSDVLMPPSVGTTLEIRCDTTGTFTV